MGKVHEGGTWRRPRTHDGNRPQCQPAIRFDHARRYAVIAGQLFRVVTREQHRLKWTANGSIRSSLMPSNSGLLLAAKVKRVRGVLIESAAFRYIRTTTPGRCRHGLGTGTSSTRALHRASTGQVQELLALGETCHHSQFRAYPDNNIVSVLKSWTRKLWRSPKGREESQ